MKKNSFLPSKIGREKLKKEARRMPGVAGFTKNEYLSEAGQILKRMQELLTHQNFWKQEELFVDENVAGTRVHINVLQKDLQPHRKDGIYIWLEGEFYNQTEIRKKAENKPSSDLEILRALYSESDNFSFLKKIEGIYAAVIYDSKGQKMHLISDRYGWRHLYWTIYKGCLVWSSELKVMLALPDFTPKIDRLALEEFLAIRYFIGDRTWFEGVELLPAATVLTWDIREKSISKQRYWWWDEIEPVTGKIDEREIAAELGRLFIDSVERRSAEAESVGLTLSGGLAPERF
ncbi:hypothetical protein [Phormidium sp. CCY1219]|uniref:hypothetical protein n=1 Tax=Phormidium sp. CCY1219 TaxID=2886104 RepID=UPI002D1EECB7|nr:hypothetical protein [Phormidium sp. CCY1219]MEB3827614.1 hypothetical protein [Phormidium sp. CCY1219]